MFLCCWCYFHSTHVVGAAFLFPYIHFLLFSHWNPLQSSGWRIVWKFQGKWGEALCTFTGITHFEEHLAKGAWAQKCFNAQKSKQISLRPLPQFAHSLLCLAHEERRIQRRQKWKIASNELWSGQGERKGLHIRHGRQQQDAPGKRMKYSVD